LDPSIRGSKAQILPDPSLPPSTKPKSRSGGGMGGDDDSDYFPLSPPRKDWFADLLRLITATVIFMGGVVLGLSVSGSVTRYYYNSHTKLIFPATTYGGGSGGSGGASQTN
jgi:hypothetical protein